MNSGWRLLLTSDDINTFVQKCADHLNNKFLDLYLNGEKITIMCILKGGVYFHVDLTRKLKFECSQYFINAKSYNNSQSQDDQIQLSNLDGIEPCKFKDRHIIIIDELFDNGKTLCNVKNKIMELSEVKDDHIYTCTLFKKRKSNNKYPNPDFYGVEVPNVWLVGYGLDDKQEKRQWNCLFGCPKSEGIDKTSDDDMFDSDDMYYFILNNIESQKDS